MVDGFLWSLFYSACMTIRRQSVAVCPFLLPWMNPSAKMSSPTMEESRLLMMVTERTTTPFPTSFFTFATLRALNPKAAFTYSVQIGTKVGDAWKTVNQLIYSARLYDDWLSTWSAVRVNAFLVRAINIMRVCGRPPKREPPPDSEGWHVNKM